MKKLILLCVWLISSTSHAYSGNQEELIRAWERIQENEELFTNFSALGDGKYQLDSDSFGFHGVAEITAVSIEYGADGYRYGNLQVQLEGKLNREPEIKSFMTNRKLVFNPVVDVWMTNEEWLRYEADKRDREWGYSFIQAVMQPVLVLGLVIFLFYFLFRRGPIHRSLQVMDKQLAVMESMDKTLSELKNK
ncbi:hypothetical protein HCH_04511 [Hahella chejuensis KCTC 2396]|uniref:Uncharacterized protein n=1 Tax=Hahella chejuensis (strain KCTC 2396) TaxID=349521 RepID=Q2SDR2_HAHCH|nr:hypothetical protein [Hahella chejuensis]ABC31212.1 hypothetical protein HCH_04511 [Hahella chejuensis KCTC 2396]